MSALHFEADIDDKKLEQKLKQIDNDLTKIAKQASRSGSVMDNAFGKVGNTLDKLGFNLSNFIGPAGALAAAFKFQQLAKEAYEFERAFGMAMREVSTISDAAKNNFEGMSESIIEMAAKGPDNAIKLAKAFYQIASAGHDGANGLKLLEVASRSAVAGVTDTLTAADGLTTIINAWGLSSEQANTVADVMFQTVKRGKTTFAELASTISQVAPLAAANNIEFEQIFAALQSLTKQGVPTAQAMTQIRSSLVNMTKVLGDGWGNVMTYQDGLNKIAEMAKGSQNELRKLIPDVEGIGAVLALTGKNAKGAAEDLNETAKSAGAMQTAYGRMMEEADNKWSIVHNKWIREVRELGKAMKEESGNLADFMDALLSSGGDINANLSIYGIADKVKALRMMGGSLIGSYIKGGLMPEQMVRDQYAKFVKSVQDYASQGLAQQQISLSDILGIKDKDERLVKLQEFLKQMKEAEADLGNVVFQNDEQQKAALKIRAELWGEVEARAKEAIKTIESEGSGKGGTPTKGRTLKTMLDELKAAQDSLGTGSMKDDIAALSRISALQQEVLKYYDKIREARKVDSLAAIKTLTGKDSLGGVRDITKEQTKHIFQGEKLLKQAKAKTEQAEKEANAIKKQNDLQIRQEAIIEDLSKGLSDTADIMGAMSFAIGEFDSTLGESVGRMADIASNASSLVSNLAAGGSPITAITSGISIIGNIIGMFRSTEQSNTIEKQMQQTQKLYSMMATLLNTLSGGDLYKAAGSQIEVYEADLERYWTKLKEYRKWTLREVQYPGGPFVKVDTSNFSLTDWVSFMDRLKKDSNTWLDHPAYLAAQEYINGILEANQAIKEAQNTLNLNLLGFTSDDLANTILDGIESGLKLSEGSLGDWSGTFGDYLKKALYNNLITNLNAGVLTNFMKTFNAAMSDTALTPDELSGLKEQFALSVSNAETLYKAINPILEQFNSPLGNASLSPMTGISAQMTEETGSLLAGQTMAIRNDIKINQNIMQNQLEAMDNALGVLNNIERNTRHNVRLNDLCELTKETNYILKNNL